MSGGGALICGGSSCTVEELKFPAGINHKLLFKTNTMVNTVCGTSMPAENCTGFNPCWQSYEVSLQRSGTLLEILTDPTSGLRQPPATWRGPWWRTQWEGRPLSQEPWQIQFRRDFPRRKGLPIHLHQESQVWKELPSIHAQWTANCYVMNQEEIICEQRITASVFSPCCKLSSVTAR